MGRILMSKKEFEAKKAEEGCCGIGHHKKAFSLLSMIAVIMIASSAMSWIGFMNIKQNGGKLPWEN